MDQATKQEITQFLLKRKQKILNKLSEVEALLKSIEADGKPVIRNSVKADSNNSSPVFESIKKGIIPQ